LRVPALPAEGGVMAGPIACDLCGEEHASAIFTNLDNGDTVSVGGACMLTFALSVAAELAGQVPEDQRDQFAQLAGAVATALLPTIPLADGGKGSVSKPPRKRRPPHIDRGEQGINLPPRDQAGEQKPSQTRSLADWQAGQQADADASGPVVERRIPGDSAHSAQEHAGPEARSESDAP